MNPSDKVDVLRKLQVGLWAATAGAEPEARWVGKKPQRAGARDRREALCSDYVADVLVTDCDDARLQCELLDHGEDEFVREWALCAADKLEIDRESVRPLPPGAFDVARTGLVWVCGRTWRSAPGAWDGEPLRARVRLEARVVPCAWAPGGRQLAVLATEALVLGRASAPG